MPSIDERVVAMRFDNAKFEAGVAKTMQTLTKLNDSLKKIGTTNGLANIEKAAHKINFSSLSSALDRLKDKLRLTGGTKGLTDVDSAAKKISFGPLGTILDGIKNKLSNLTAGPSAALDRFKEKLKFTGADKGLNNLETASNKVKFAGPIAALNSLKDKLRFPGVENNFTNIEKASGRVRFSGMITAIGDVSASFSTLQAAAAVALGNIVTKAALAGGQLVKSLTVSPITVGLKEYETNLNSIQTILANTQASGATLDDVNEALLQLNKYSDQTIYNFSQMAKNIGTFTAAGVDLKTSTQAIKGIANLAALSGSNSEQASTAMYQLSQAIAAGRVSLQDWNSVVNAGMGGTVFQRALAQTAQAMGTLKDGTVKLTGPMKNVSIAGESFRESITAKPGQESWLTSDVLTNTLSQFTGDLSDAELAAMGFNEEQIQAIQQTAKTAKLAATEVKTLSGVFDVAKESIGSGWAQTFQLIFGDFGEAKSLFTGVSQAITGFISKNAEARNKVIGDWKELGGRKVLIEGIKDVFQALGSILKPIKQAFRDIFPAKTGKDLFDLTKRFGEFAEKLKIGPETANNLRRTFAGFFAILSIGKSIISGILGVFGDLLGAATDGSGGFLNFTGTIGDFLVSVDKAIKEGDGLKNFFEGLGTVLALPIKLLSKFADLLGNLFSGGGDSEELTSSLDDMEESLSPVTIALNAVAGAWEGFLNILRSVRSALGPVVDEIGNVFGQFGDAVANALEGANFDQVFAIIQTTLIGGIFLVIKKAFGGGLKVDFGGGLLKSMGETMGALTGSLKAMQTSIKAGTILKIAAAVTVLAAGVVALSLIDPKRLASAMTAVSVGLGQLVGAMALLTKIGGVSSFLTMPFIAGSLILLATAVDVLAVAVFAFSRLTWEELIKGLVGVGGALVAIGAGIRLIPPSVVLIGPALLPLALALNIMAIAVKIFSTMDWEELAKGLIGVAGALTAIGVGTKLLGPSILLIGPGLIAVAVALNLLSLAVLAFGKMDLKTMAKGLLGIAGSLIAIGVAIKLIPPTVALQAAGLILLSIALTGIAGAIALMGGLAIKTIAKGIAAIGLALVVLAGGLTLMGATIPGAVALLGAAAALAVLAPVIGILGTMKWSTIAKGLAAIAALLATLAIVGSLASPGLIALGIGLVALGAGVALVGAGVNMLATGLVKLGGEGSKGVTTLMVALTALVALLPKIIIDFLKGVVAIVESIAELAPKVVDSMVKIVESLLEVVIKSAPKMALAMTAVITAGIAVIDANAPNIIAAGFRLLISFLSGIANNIGEVIEAGANVIVNFLTSILTEIPKIISSGANVIVKFLVGIVATFPRVIAAAAQAIAKFLTGVAQNMPKIVSAGVKLIVKFLEGVASNIGKIIKAGANLIVKVIEGITSNMPKVIRAATKMVAEFFDEAVRAGLRLINAGAKAVINFINGVAAAVRANSGKLGEAGANLGIALVEGMIRGLGSMAGALVKKAIGIFGGVPKKIKGLLGIGSPSKVFAEIGKFMMLGVVVGIDEHGNQIIRALESTSEDMINIMTNSLSVVPDLLDGLMDMDPVITPILDLTSVQQSAKQLADLTNVVPITAAASYSQAASISAAQEVSQTTADQPSPPPVTPINFEQNNYSPESLSPTEIYRQTRNQLSQAKKALDLVS